MKTMLICFYDSKGIVHKELVPPGQAFAGSWRLLHENAPSHRSTLVADYLHKNHILTIHHSPDSPDTALWDFYLFGKMRKMMKGKRYADVEAIQKACTGILAAIPGNELKYSFDMLLDRAKICIKAGDYFE